MVWTLSKGTKKLNLDAMFMYVDVRGLEMSMQRSRKMLIELDDLKGTLKGRIYCCEF